ncbi:Site-specific recombinase XerD [Geodermatophilus obscurus]|uniref:Site-specific recombinase XerD n=1 Tax=Geodermatophilus obscurus TaxID=1861 RepID=A0A1I5DNJ6_9ACTN|nr:site-specific integrase [Geodermatophilus obscurus]SFO00793.1 Site-specific recombinase XerD [Geodermatophilus obscurus]
MASIQDRWRRKDPVTGKLVPTAQDGKGLRYRPQFRDPSGRQVAKSFALKRDAQRWLDEQTAHVARGTYVDPGAGRITFAEFYADWSERQVWAPGTVLAMRLAANSVPFADVPLRSLRRSHVEGWVKGMVSRGLAPGTVHTRMNNVRAVLRGAVADRLIPTDPSVGVALPRRRRPQAAMTLPTAAQVGRILDAADPAFRPFVALCAFAGLRLGEAAGLQVADIDFLRRTLTVARQVQRAGRGQVEVRPPKYGSERVVFLAPGLVEMLAVHVAAQNHEGGWMFTGEGDQPPHQNTVGHRWRTAITAAGISGLRLHDLRHFYASGLIASGCDVVTVQRALGHSSATTTLSTYSHLWPSAEDRTRAAAQAMLTESYGPEADRSTTGGR